MANDLRIVFSKSVSVEQMTQQLFYINDKRFDNIFTIVQSVKGWTITGPFLTRLDIRRRTSKHIEWYMAIDPVAFWIHQTFIHSSVRNIDKNAMYFSEGDTKTTSSIDFDEVYPTLEEWVVATMRFSPPDMTEDLLSVVMKMTPAQFWERRFT